MATTKTQSPLTRLWNEYDIILAALLAALPIYAYRWIQFTQEGGPGSIISTRLNNVQTIGLVALIAGIIWLLQFSTLKTKQKSQILRFIAHTAALAALFAIFWDIWFWDSASDTWLDSMIKYTGRNGLLFLVLSLAITPLVTLFGWSALNSTKKPLGNYGFALVLIHFAMFSLEYGRNADGIIVLGTVIEEAIFRQYALLGMLAFIFLIPLAVTSNKYSQKRLKKDWKKLHRLVYIINILGVAHYIWIRMSKLALAQPIAYAVIVAFLLILRLDLVKSRIRDYKKARRAKARATT